jgi:hypothetical protein
MLEEHLAAIDRKAQLTQWRPVSPGPKVVHDQAHVLQGNALAAHRGDDEQLDQVGKRGEPNGGTNVEIAPDGGNDKPVSSQ